MNTRTGGWSLLELSVSITVLVVALLGLATGLHGTARLEETNRENQLLGVACKNLIAELRTVSFSTVVASYGAGSGKENFWIGSDKKLYFATKADALATGQIEFFNNESAMPSSWTQFSGGLDLNANGTVESTVTDYRVLPTRFTLNLTRPDGVRTHVLNLILTEPSS